VDAAKKGIYQMGRKNKNMEINGCGKQRKKLKKEKIKQTEQIIHTPRK
jgi:hypothetical protein